MFIKEELQNELRLSFSKKWLNYHQVELHKQFVFSASLIQRHLQIPFSMSYIIMSYSFFMSAITISSYTLYPQCCACPVPSFRLCIFLMIFLQPVIFVTRISVLLYYHSRYFTVFAAAIPVHLSCYCLLCWLRTTNPQIMPPLAMSQPVLPTVSPIYSILLLPYKIYVVSLLHNLMFDCTNRLCYFSLAFFFQTVRSAQLCHDLDMFI